MQHVYEARDIWTRGFFREWISADKVNNLFRGTNNDLAFEGQLSSKRGAKHRLVHTFAHHKRSDRSNISYLKPGQLLCNQRGLTSIGSTNVYRTKKYDGSHVSVCTHEWPVTSNK